MLSGPCVGREVGKSLVATRQVNVGGWLVHSQTTVGSYGTRKVFPVHRPSILQCMCAGGCWSSLAIFYVSCCSFRVQESLLTCTRMTNVII
jgi:hypothetical protein